MIRATVRSDGDEYTLKMTGHAMYHPGNDVVCAGASAIAFALAGYLHNCGAHLLETVEERLESGDLCLRCRGDEMVGEAYRMALVGLLQIAAQYPDHMEVSADLEGF